MLPPLFPPLIPPIQPPSKKFFRGAAGADCSHGGESPPGGGRQLFPRPRNFPPYNRGKNFFQGVQGRRRAKKIPPAREGRGAGSRGGRSVLEIACGGKGSITGDPRKVNPFLPEIPLCVIREEVAPGIFPRLPAGGDNLRKLPVQLVPNNIHDFFAQFHRSFLRSIVPPGGRCFFLPFYIPPVACAVQPGEIFFSGGGGVFSWGTPPPRGGGGVSFRLYSPRSPRGIQPPGKEISPPPGEGGGGGGGRRGISPGAGGGVIPPPPSPGRFVPPGGGGAGQSPSILPVGCRTPAQFRGGLLRRFEPVPPPLQAPGE